MNDRDVSDYCWLTSLAAAPWLAEAAASRDAVTTLAKKLRRELSPSRTHLVLEQVALRRRAAAKFPAAERMFFTSRSLEQATSETVAAWKAGRFVRLAGDRCDAWADLCCGVGGDLVSLAARRQTIGVDRDEILVVLAEANLAAGGSLSATVRCGDVRDFPIKDVTAWHLDPDRRTEAGRVAQPALAEPGIEAIDDLLQKNPHGAIKLAPAARPPERWIERCELEWISERGECKQQTAWFGSLCRIPGLRSATVLSRDQPPRTISGEVGTLSPIARAVGRYIYQADAAVLAAGLSASLAAEHGLSILGSETGYLTGDRAVSDAALAGFETLESIPFDRRKLKSLLRSRNLRIDEVKKRGFELDLEGLRQELRGRGEQTVTLLLTPVAGAVTAILARRLRA